MDDQPAEGGLPVGAIRPLPQGPQSSDGISWRDIQDINVRLGNIKLRVDAMESGAAGKSNRSFQVYLVLIAAFLSSGLTVVGTIAVNHFGGEDAAAAAEEAP